MIQKETDDARSALGLQHKYLLSNDPTAPLIFLVHGRAGTLDVMWTFKRTLPEECSIIAPQAPRPDRIGGFSWWDVEAGRHIHADTVAASQTLTKFLKESCKYYGLRPRTQLALGFSQGAGLLSLTIQREPNLLAGTALLAGFVLREPVSGLTPPLSEVLMLHGSQDDIVPAAQAREGAEYLRTLGFSVHFHEDPVGHKVGAAGMRILGEWNRKLLF